MHAICGRRSTRNSSFALIALKEMTNVVVYTTCKYINDIHGMNAKQIKRNSENNTQRATINEIAPLQQLHIRPHTHETKIERKM